ncbi:MAG: right-handed parallel beta-helix repeat-containing protein [Candidatus Thermoplasmatota archaeon]|nr:right-handed parallel beta-helix repeat-containing protein [Candidatus Thermoplasmatota archaeon]
MSIMQGKSGAVDYSPVRRTYVDRRRKASAFFVSLTFFLILFMPLIGIGTSSALTVGPGGSGADYTSIQAAIDAAAPGETIEVWAGTYYENVVVNKPISIIGSDWSTTIIDAQGGIGVHITSDNVNITDFKITNGAYGIFVENSSHVDINWVNCSHHSITGIFVDPSDNITLGNASGTDNQQWFLRVKDSNNVNVDNVNVQDSDGNTAGVLNAENCDGFSANNINWKIGGSDFIVGGRLSNSRNIALYELNGTQHTGTFFEFTNCSNANLINCTAQGNATMALYANSTANLTVEGLAADNKTIEAVDCGEVAIRKRPGKTKYRNLILKRGYADKAMEKLWITDKVVVETSNVTIKNVTIDGEGGAGAPLQFNKSNNLVIKNVTIHSFNSPGISISDCQNINIDGLTLNASSSQDPESGCGDGITAWKWEIGNVTNSTIRTNNGTGIRLNNTSSVTIQNANITVKNGTGIRVSKSNYCNVSDSKIVVANGTGHAYDECESPYTVRVEVVDDDNGQATDSFQVTGLEVRDSKNVTAQDVKVNITNGTGIKLNNTKNVIIQNADIAVKNGTAFEVKYSDTATFEEIEIYVFSPPPSGHIVEISDSEEVTLRKVNIDCPEDDSPWDPNSEMYDADGASSTDSIQVDTSQDVKIENSTLNNAPGNRINLNNTSNVTIVNTNITVTNGTGIKMNNTTNVTIQKANITVRNGSAADVKNSKNIAFVESFFDVMFDVPEFNNSAITLFNTTNVTIGSTNITVANGSAVNAEYSNETWFIDSFFDVFHGDGLEGMATAVRLKNFFDAFLENIWMDMIYDVPAQGNSVVFADEGEGLSVCDSDFWVNGGEHVRARNVKGLRVSGNGMHCTTPDCDGARFTDVDDGEFSDNHMDRPPGAGSTDVHVHGGTNFMIINNTLEGHGGLGIEIMGLQGGEISENTIRNKDKGIQLENSMNVKIESCILENNGIGVSSMSSNEIDMTNCSIMGSTMFDISVAGGDITALNTNFATSDVAPDGILTVQWFLDVHVYDWEMKPVKDAVIRVYDSLNNLVAYRNPATWDPTDEGWLHWAVITEYVQNGVDIFGQTPHRITAANFTSKANDLIIPITHSQVVIMKLEEPHGGPVYNVDTGMSYPTIPMAIGDQLTMDGHTLLVSSGFYEEVGEPLVVDKRLSIIGQGHETTTIIGGQAMGSAITITAPEVTFHGFRIETSSLEQGGILADWNMFQHIDIQGNRIISQYYGITINNEPMPMRNSKISNNIIEISDSFMLDGGGIRLIGCNEMIVSDNILIGEEYIDGKSPSIKGIAPPYTGIALNGSHGWTISGNTIQGWNLGINIDSCDGWNLYGNTINGWNLGNDGVAIDNSNNWNMHNNTINGWNLKGGYGVEIHYSNGWNLNNNQIFGWNLVAVDVFNGACTIGGNTLHNNTVGIKVFQTSNLVIQGNVIDGWNLGDVGVQIDQSDGWNLLGNTIRGWNLASTGVQTTNSDNWLMGGNTIQGWNLIADIDTCNGWNLGWNLNGNTIDGWNLGQNGIKIESSNGWNLGYNTINGWNLNGATGVSINTATGWNLGYNTIYGWNLGIQVSNAGCILHNNSIHNNTAGMVAFLTNNFTIESNTFSDNTNTAVALQVDSTMVFRNNILTGNDLALNLTGTWQAGFFIENCTFSSNTYNFNMAIGHAPYTLNCTFETWFAGMLHPSTSASASLTIKNYLHVEVYDNASSPREGSTVWLNDTGAITALGTTDSDGKLYWNIVTDRIITTAAVAENTTGVNITYGIKNFNNAPRTVNMSSSRLEIFNEIWLSISLMVVNLTLSQSGSDIVLGWGHVEWGGNVDRFNVYRSLDRFAVFPGGWSLIGDGVFVQSHVDAGVYVDGNTYFYVVVPRNPVYVGPGSEVVVKQSRTFTRNAANSNVMWVSIPYNSGITQASDIVVALEGGTGAGTNLKIEAIFKWDPVAQSSSEFYGYTPSPPALRGWNSGTNFAISPGDGIAIALSATATTFDWVILGTDNVPGVSRTFTRNAANSNVMWVSIGPGTTYTQASDIVLALEGGTGAGTNLKIEAIFKWDPVAQSASEFYGYTPSPPALRGWNSGTNFAISPGDGIAIALSATATTFTWTFDILEV